MPGCRCRRHPQTGIATESTKQQPGGFLDLGEGDRRIRVVTLRRTGDQLMPERADVLFHGR